MSSTRAYRLDTAAARRHSADGYIQNGLLMVNLAPGIRLDYRYYPHDAISLTNEWMAGQAHFSSPLFSLISARSSHHQA